MKSRWLLPTYPPIIRSRHVWKRLRRCTKVLEDSPRTQPTHPARPNPTQPEHRITTDFFLVTAVHRAIARVLARFSEVFGHRSKGRGARSSPPSPMDSVFRSFSRDVFTFPDPRAMFYRFYDRYRIFNDRRFRPFPFAFYCESIRLLSFLFLFFFWKKEDWKIFNCRFFLFERRRQNLENF